MQEEQSGAGAPGGPAIATRWPELAVAALLFGAGLLVVTDSIRVGTGWADDGPRSGYFPFYIGCLLLGSSGWVLLGQLLRWTRDREVFAEAHEWKGVWMMLWPTAVYMAAIPFLGIYVSSFLLIALFMKRHGGFGWGLSVLVGAGVPLFFFIMFERWFLVLLPKGPLERMLGF